MEDELSAEAILGDEARKFLEGDLGRYMRGCAEQDVQEALLDLEDADPEDHKKIRDIQNKIWRARNFPVWLNELVQRGEEALRVYQQQQKE
jgi:hypothetical protein